MTFLFSSDLHGRQAAFASFALTLRTGPYEAGILAGDLLDEWLPAAEVDVLAGPRGGSAAGADRLGRALRVRQEQLQALLETARKPIFFVLGNHDVTPWPDSPWLTDLHGRPVDFGGHRLAGYRWTRMDRYPDELQADLPALLDMVTPETILVTHSPPWGVLDGVPGTRFRFGLKTLNRLTPRLHLFGHVHECAGVEGRAVNGSWPALRKFYAIDPAEPSIELVDPTSRLEA